MTDPIRFFKKLGLLGAPLMVLYVIELFFLPIDRFTFRVWEALYAGENTSLFLPGPFYPASQLSKIEKGDLAPHSPLAVEKNVVWQIDDYGYRDDFSPAAPPKIVIVGDSIVAGSSLSQQETLAVQLSKKLGKPVYSFAPGSMNRLLWDDRFRAN